ncbi:MAG: addiction module protein [Fimbriiglobus sp.]|nr:addiction module protein [Fimbriiglobus sp.]
MSETMSTILAQALQLSTAERRELIERLADSLDPPAGAEALSDAEFTAELERRAAELRADPSAGLPWDQVREMR